VLLIGALGNDPPDLLLVERRGGLMLPYEVGSEQLA
jgi:hypothetical protein